MNNEANDALVRFETRMAQQVVGIQITSHSSLLPILMPPLWQTFTNRLTTIRHCLPSDELLSVHRQHGEEETYCICAAVSSLQDLPTGMIGFEVPAQNYAVFQHTGSYAELAASYQEIQRWLNEHADDYRTLPTPQAFAFETYSLPLNLAGDRLNCEIYIPIEQVIPALRGLDAIDWSQVHGCYGTGDAIADLQPLPHSEHRERGQFVSAHTQQRPLTSIPDMLRLLTSEDAEQRQHAIRVLEYNLEHQGSLYAGSAAVAPFLSKLLQEPSAPDKLSLLRLLTIFAQRYHVDNKPHRPYRPFAVEEINKIVVKGYEHDVHWGMQTHNAVRNGLASAFPFLSQNDPQLCIAALCLLGCFKEDRALIVPHVQALLETTPDESIQAYSLYCLGALLAATNKGTDLFIPYLAMDHPEGIRLSAAIALCVIMREQMSEAILKRIHDADIYPHAISGNDYGMHEHWQYAEWLDRQAKYFLALMSVTTVENRFVPEPFRIPPEFNTLFGNMPNMMQSLNSEHIHYPPWFNQYYVEDAAIMLLRFCFPTDKVSASYSDLNRRQQRVLSMLAEHEIFWPDQKPYLIRRQMQERFQKMEEHLGSKNISEKTRDALSFLNPSEYGSYEVALEASEMIQVLRQLGLPAMQAALQAYISV